MGIPLAAVAREALPTAALLSRFKAEKQQIEREARAAKKKAAADRECALGEPAVSKSCILLLQHHLTERSRELS